MFYDSTMPGAGSPVGVEPMSRSETLQSFGTQTSAISRAFRAEHLGDDVESFEHRDALASPELDLSVIVTGGE